MMHHFLPDRKTSGTEQISVRMKRKSPATDKVAAGGLSPQCGYGPYVWNAYILASLMIRTQSDSQLLAAATTTGGQHTAAIPRGHTRPETVHLAALTLLGLIRTEHAQHSSMISSTGKNRKPANKQTAFEVYRNDMPLSS